MHPCALDRGVVYVRLVSDHVMTSWLLVAFELWTFELLRILSSHLTWAVKQRKPSANLVWGALQMKRRLNFYDTYAWVTRIPMDEALRFNDPVYLASLLSAGLHPDTLLVSIV